jgi:hypothetical protein
VRRLYYFFLELPENVERMTIDELLLCATLLSLVVTVVLMISGRKLA